MYEVVVVKVDFLTIVSPKYIESEQKASLWSLSPSVWPVAPASVASPLAVVLEVSVRLKLLS